MNTYATTSPENTQAHSGALGQILDSFIGIITSPEISEPKKCSFSELERSFNITKGLPETLLVVHVDNDLSECEEDATARLAHQQRIAQQLSSACGQRALVAPIGQKEYAVLLHDIHRCSELIPRLDGILSRTIAGHLNGDGMSLICKLGVARSPLDGDELSDLIRMASSAAAELGFGELGYQFISRRHR